MQVRGRRSIKHQNLFLPRHLSSSSHTPQQAQFSLFDLVTTKQFKMGFTDVLTDAGLAGMFPPTLRALRIALRIAIPANDCQCSTTGS
jgi:hypothetical protein